MKTKKIAALMCTFVLILMSMTITAFAAYESVWFSPHTIAGGASKLYWESDSSGVPVAAGGRGYINVSFSETVKYQLGIWFSTSGYKYGAIKTDSGSGYSIGTASACKAKGYVANKQSTSISITDGFLGWDA